MLTKLLDLVPAKVRCLFGIHRPNYGGDGLGQWRECKDCHTLQKAAGYDPLYGATRWKTVHGTHRH